MDRIAHGLALWCMACAPVPALPEAGTVSDAQNQDAQPAPDARMTRDAAREAGQDANSGDAAEQVESDGGAAPGVAAYAGWPMPNLPDRGLPHAQRYRTTEHLLLDEVTGLSWARRETEGLSTWRQALQACGSLVLEGRDDFRLPSRIEWVSILDPSRSPSAPTGLLQPQAEYHWTASGAGADSQFAYSVYLGAGLTTIASVDGQSARVRCVTGGPAPSPEPPFEVLGERVRDRATGLQWERAHGSSGPFEGAQARCAEMGGRLPSLRELQTLVDETRSQPAIDPNAFPDAAAARYFSATPSRVSELEVWVVDFQNGKTLEQPRALPARGRCILSSEGD